MSLRSVSRGTLQQGACADAIVALDVRKGQSHTQVENVGCRLNATLEHRQCFIVSPASRELIAVFEKCRNERWPSCGDPLQSFQSIIRSARRCKGAREFELDRRILAAPRRPLQRSDRFVRAALHHERPPENLSGENIAAVGLEYARGHALRFIGTLHPQRKKGAVERLLSRPRLAGDSAMWRMF